MHNWDRDTDAVDAGVIGRKSSGAALARRAWLGPAAGHVRPHRQGARYSGTPSHRPAGARLGPAGVVVLRHAAGGLGRRGRGRHRRGLHGLQAQAAALVRPDGANGGHQRRHTGPRHLRSRLQRLPARRRDSRSRSWPSSRRSPRSTCSRRPSPRATSRATPRFGQVSARHCAALRGARLPHSDAGARVRRIRRSRRGRRLRAALRRAGARGQPAVLRAGCGDGHHHGLRGSPVRRAARRPLAGRDGVQCLYRRPAARAGSTSSAATSACPRRPAWESRSTSRRLETFRRNATGPKPLPCAIYTVRWADGGTAEYVSVRAYERDFTLRQPAGIRARRHADHTARTTVASSSTTATGPWHQVASAPPALPIPSF